MFIPDESLCQVLQEDLIDAPPMEPPSSSLISTVSTPIPFVCFAAGSNASALHFAPIDYFEPLPLVAEPISPTPQKIELPSIVKEIRMESFGEELLVAAVGAGARLYIARGPVEHHIGLVDVLSFNDTLHTCALNHSLHGELAAVTARGSVLLLKLEGTRCARILKVGDRDEAWHACTFGGHCASLMTAGRRELVEYDLRSHKPASRNFLPEMFRDYPLGAIAQPKSESLHFAIV